MDSKSFRSFDGHLDKKEKLLVECMLSDIAMGGIRKGPICSLTNPAYEVSFGFTNIYELALST